VTLKKGENGKNRVPDPIVPVHGRLFRARGAAQYLGIKESRLRALIRTGDLIAVRNSRGRLEGVYESDCDVWIAAHRRAVEPITPPPSGDERIAHLLPKERHFL
jgi:hypothetical protein